MVKGTVLEDNGINFSTLREILKTINIMVMVN